MSPEPLVKPLPYEHRVWFFRILLLVFFCTVPVFIFYATGYRLTLFTETGENIITVGGMFISAETEDTQIYINEELVDNFRIFQRAAYIQNLPAGMHRVHVQGEGVHTWVKELPVYPRIVTEATAFNLPLVPQVRFVPEYVAGDGTAIFIGSTSTLPASGTVVYRNTFVASTTIASSSLALNPEFVYLDGRFGTTSATSTTILDRLNEELENFRFSSTAGTSSGSTTRATTTKESRDRVLYQSGDRIYVAWRGSENSIPFYYCFHYADATSTAALYSEHGREQIANVYESLEPLERGSRTCRDTIPIDTKDYEVYSFDFFPQNNDLILLHTDAGVLVVEADDRAWQNTQLLYPAGEYELLVDGNQLFIREDDVIFELLTSLE